MEIIIITINSKEIIDFVNENNGIEIYVGKKSYYIIENKNDIYYVWNNFTENIVENDEYLFNFRVFCENKKYYDIIIWYKPCTMIKYMQKYRNQPIYELEDITNYHYKTILKRVLDMFKDNSFVSNENRLNNTLKYELLQNILGDVYEFNFRNKNFKNKFKNACTIS